MFDNAPVVNQFNGVKGVDASVRNQIVGWNDKIREYLRKIFNSNFERVQGTKFGDNISKITYITERVAMEPDAFRGVRDV